MLSGFCPEASFLSTRVRCGVSDLNPPIGRRLDPVKNFKNSDLFSGVISVMYLIKFWY